MDDQSGLTPAERNLPVLRPLCRAALSVDDAPGRSYVDRYLKTVCTLLRPPAQMLSQEKFAAAMDALIADLDRAQTRVPYESPERCERWVHAAWYLAAAKDLYEQHASRD